jgi:hypothetical protein
MKEEKEATGQNSKGRRKGKSVKAHHKTAQIRL